MNIDGKTEKGREISKTLINQNVYRNTRVRLLLPTLTDCEKLKSKNDRFEKKKESL